MKSMRPISSVRTVRLHAKNDGFRTENDGFCTETDGFRTETDGLSTETDGFSTKNDDFANKVVGMFVPMGVGTWSEKS